uniref:Putative conserved secreted protein n=1 Tax=Ixodes ricinus TaxID=34613 RepID=A0A147BGC3_IXORI
MEVKWMLAYFLLSSSLVFGIATKVETSTEKAPPNPTKPASSNVTPTQKETAASTSTQAKHKEATPKTTAAPQPSAPRPSTDPIICGLKNNNSDFALPSLQCTLRHLPQNLTKNWNNYMEARGKNESDLLNDICEAGKNGTNPDFMANYTENDKAMIHDTSTLCRIRHTTKSECKIPNLIE